MKTKNLMKMKIKMGGKGGSIFTLSLFLLIFIFAFTTLSFAGRSDAGGGDVTKFSIGKWALTKAISFGATLGGSYAGSYVTGVSSSWSLSGATNLWASSASSSFASTQAQGAISAEGSYRGWSTKKINLLSSIGGGLVSKGGVGAVGGLTTGLIKNSLMTTETSNLSNKYGNHWNKTYDEDSKKYVYTKNSAWQNGVAELAGSIVNYSLNMPTSTAPASSITLNTSNLSNIGFYLNQMADASIKVYASQVASHSKNTQNKEMISAAFDGLTTFVDAAAKGYATKQETSKQLNTIDKVLTGGGKNDAGSQKDLSMVRSYLTDNNKLNSDASTVKAAYGRLNDTLKQPSISNGRGNSIVDANKAINSIGIKLTSAASSKSTVSGDKVSPDAAAPGVTLKVEFMQKPNIVASTTKVQ